MAATEASPAATRSLPLAFAAEARQKVSDLFELLPAFLSHHPDQEDPQPTHVERPWNRPG